MPVSVYLFVQDYMFVHVCVLLVCPFSFVCACACLCVCEDYGTSIFRTQLQAVLQAVASQTARLNLSVATQFLCVLNVNLVSFDGEAYVV